MRRSVENFTLPIPVAETLEEANELIREVFMAHAEAVGLLRKKLNENEALNANMSTTQARCSELLLENRELKRLYEASTGNRPPAVLLMPGDIAFQKEQTKRVEKNGG